MATNVTQNRKLALAARRPETMRQKAHDLEQVLGPCPYLTHVLSIKDPDLTSTIAVEIPAFCDPDLIPTIKSALYHAANPWRIHFCICLQDNDPERIEFLKKVPNCKFEIIDPNEAPGTCTARKICQDLMKNEKFALHTDSHMRFADFWDVTLINCWQENKIEKSVISAYMDKLEIDELMLPAEDSLLTRKATTNKCAITRPVMFDRTPMLFRCGGVYRTSSRNIEGAFVCGSMLFGPSGFDRDVPYDPNTWYASDESPFSARLWTHGWRIFSPHVRGIYHLYNRTSVYKESPRFAEKTPKNAFGGSIHVSERVHNQILYGVIGETEYLGIYGPGKEHSMAEYMNFAGIDYANQQIRMFAHKGEFDKYHTTEDYAVWKKE